MRVEFVPDDEVHRLPVHELRESKSESENGGRYACKGGGREEWGLGK
jgi:hypothetical protein